MKKLLLALLLLAFPLTAHGATVGWNRTGTVLSPLFQNDSLKLPYLGGGGNLCLGTDNLGAITAVACGTGGGGGAGTWSTTTSTVSGQLTNYTNNATDIVTIGSNATTTAEYWFDPNTNNAYMAGTLGIGMSAGQALDVSGNMRTTGSLLWLNTGGGGTNNFINGASVANTIRFGINDANVMYLTNVGLGVGTSTPSARLSVTGPDTSTGRAFVVADSSNVEMLSVLDNGTMGLNVSPSGVLHVKGTVGTAPANNAQTTVRVESSATAGVGVGPSLLFRGQTGNSTADYGFAGIQGAKESATASNYDGYMALFTQRGSSAALTEAMRITSAGRVGIGTSTPAGTLEVAGATLITGTSGGVGSYVQFRNASNPIGIIGSDGSISGASPTALGMYVYGANPIDFWTNSSRVMRLTAGGLVGIGTTTPANLVDISGNNPYLAIDSANAGNAGFKINEQSAERWRIDNIASGDRLRILAGVTTEVMSLTQAGNVGIGTPTPPTRLTVGSTSAALSSNMPGGLGISASFGTGSVFGAENTSASSPSGGAFGLFYSNDGAAMASGDRLGGFLFGGSSSNTTLRNTAGMVAYATQNWVDGSAYGSRLTFEVNPNNSTSRSSIMTLLGNGNVGINVTSPNESLEVASTSGARMIVSDGGGASRKVVLITSPSASIGYGRVEAYDYGGSVGLPLVLNNAGQGNVYVGTTTGTAKTNLAGDLAVRETSAGSSQVRYVDVGGTERWQTYLSSGDFNLYDTAQSTARLTIQDITGFTGLGTSTPRFALQVATATPQISITDTGAGTNSKHWLLGNYDGVFAIGTSTDALNATSSLVEIRGAVPSLTIATTTSATTTIYMGKIQLDGYTDAGARVCSYIVGTSWVIQTGPCL